MPDVREIDAHEKPPQDADWVLVERTPSGKFTANGSTGWAKGAAFFRPPNFETQVAAISAALAWADENGVPVVYVRAKP